MDKIPVNIWDDYYEDGHIPENEVQETYMYIEDSNISSRTKKKHLETIFSYIIKNIDLDKVYMEIKLYDSRKKYPTLDEIYHFDRYELRFTNLTHKQREELIPKLNKSTLNKVFKFYSES